MGMAIAIYLAVSIIGLAIYPPVGEDEPWIASASYKLATEGVYGTDLFTGYYGSEHHLYNLNPLYHYLLAGVFGMAGVGVPQMRALPLLFGLALLIVTALTARQILGKWFVNRTLYLLLFLRLTGLDTGFGIPLLDIARIGRPDIAVPVVGLIAFLLFERWSRNDTGGWRHIAVGSIIGVASLFHLYGAFWLPALLVLMLVREGPRILRDRRAYLMIAGFILPWVPLAIYIATGWDDFLGQTRFVAGRFDLFDPGFYLHNLLHEIDRYAALRLVRRDGAVDLLRPGAWIALIAIPTALFMMLRRGKISRYDGPFSVALVLTVQAVLFALLLSIKFFNYAIALWPLAVLCIAWLGGVLMGRRPRAVRIAVLLLLVMTGVEGGVKIIQVRRAISRSTPYTDYTDAVARYIPPGSRVLGLQHYWLGLHRYDYRSWLLPVIRTDSAFTRDPIPLDRAMEEAAPDVILIDLHMRKYFAEVADPANPRHAHSLELERYMDRHAVVLAGAVDDATYGRVEIYHITR